MFTCNPGYLSPRWLNHVHQTTPLTLLSTWPCHQQNCSLNQVGQTGETAIYLTNQANHAKLLIKQPYHWQWCSPDQPCKAAAHQTRPLKMMFTWPDRPTRWSCSPVHIINKDVHLTNQANQLTIVVTCNTRFPVIQGDLTRSPNQGGWKSFNHVTQSANWHWCSFDQSGQVGQTDDIVVHSTN